MCWWALEATNCRFVSLPVRLRGCCRSGGLLAGFLRRALLLRRARLALGGRLLRRGRRSRRRAGLLWRRRRPLVRHGGPRIIVRGRGRGDAVKPAVIFEIGRASCRDRG